MDDQYLVKPGMSPKKQIDILAKFIVEQVPGEPSESDGAVNAAIRLIKTTYRCSSMSQRKSGK